MAKRLDSATEWDGGYRVIDAQPVAPSPAGEAWRPAAGELFKLSLGASFSFFLAALLIAWAGGADFADAFRMAAKWGGLSLGILWPLLIAVYTGVIERILGKIGELRQAARTHELEAKRLEAMRQVRLAEIKMQETVSLARAELEEDRASVARQALIIGSANVLPSGHTPYDPVEAALIRAVREAYSVADDKGWLPAASPFGKRQVGEGAYPVIVERLRNPGAKLGVIGSPPVAEFDEATRRWRINLRAYPTCADALAALVGRRDVA